MRGAAGGPGHVPDLGKGAGLDHDHEIAGNSSFCQYINLLNDAEIALYLFFLWLLLEICYACYIKLDE